MNISGYRALKPPAVFLFCLEYQLNIQSMKHSPGEHVKKSGSVCNSWRKQATRLVVFRGPKITRKVMLPLPLQPARRSVKGCFKRLRQTASMERRLWIKLYHTFDKNSSNLRKLLECATYAIIYDLTYRFLVTWSLWHENEGPSGWSKVDNAGKIKKTFNKMRRLLQG